MALTSEQLGAFVRRNPISCGCGTLCVVLLLAMYYRWDTGEKDIAELEKKSIEAEQLAINIKNSAQLKEQTEALESDQKIIESRLIQVADLARNQQYFFRLEASSGVKLNDCRQNAIVAAKDRKVAAYVAVPFTLTIQGDYKQLLTFVRQLENGFHYCRINNATLSVSPQSGEGAALLLMLNLELLGMQP